MIKLEKYTSFYYKAKIPPSSGIKELLVEEAYVRLRKPYLPDVGEITGFQLVHETGYKFILHKRRNYKTIFFTKEVLDEIAPFVVKSIGCDKFTHLVISTNIFNSIYFDYKNEVIEFLGFTPKDVTHPTTVVLLGDKDCNLTSKELRKAFAGKIVFSYPYG